ncbi:MAG TPA: RNA polymerase subunit sigma-70 [Acidimicrobiales bacterium]|jgi:RNA polymerase sigma-70 factor (ECF subfamily)|nr:RNA polymerase subunit sigma-70 [Acidimicrobiales bacterium]
MPTRQASREHADCAASREPRTLQPGLEQHRRELTGYCRRVLGSAFEAEDAVQETLVRAWRNFDRFEGRATLRSWLYRIATNVCADMMRRPQRRARPMDIGPLTHEEAHGAARTPCSGAGLAAADPSEMVASRERILLALAVLQQLPSRQRAVLILREVLRWRAEEVAELLGSTVASVNSALQRARRALAAADVGAADGGAPVDSSRCQQLAACVDAFGQVDVESLMGLLQRDATDARRRDRRVPGATSVQQEPTTN